MLWVTCQFKSGACQKRCSQVQIIALVHLSVPFRLYHSCLLPYLCICMSCAWCPHQCWIQSWISVVKSVHCQIWNPCVPWEKDNQMGFADRKRGRWLTAFLLSKLSVQSKHSPCETLTLFVSISLRSPLSYPSHPPPSISFRTAREGKSRASTAEGTGIVT